MAFLQDGVTNYTLGTTVQLRERHFQLTAQVAGPEEAMKDFRQLKVWEKAHQLTLNIYRLTAQFPRAEAYGLTSQIRRAGASIGANLAEGCGRDGDAELGRFCRIARGSASELEYHLLLAKDLGLLQARDYHKMSEQTIEIKRMLTALIEKLNAES